MNNPPSRAENVSRHQRRVAGTVLYNRRDTAAAVATGGAGAWRAAVVGGKELKYFTEAVGGMTVDDSEVSGGLGPQAGFAFSFSVTLSAG